MISLDLAQNLKDEGLKWIPRDGDFFATGIKGMENIFVVSGEHYLAPELGGKMWFFHGCFCNRDGGCNMSSTSTDCMNMDGVVPRVLDVQVVSVKKMLFMPRLDQMLAEIERRSQRWSLQKLGNQYWCRINEFSDASDFDSEIVPVVEDAVAEALLYVMEVYGDKDVEVIESEIRNNCEPYGAW